MIFVYNYGTPLTTAQANALNSFVALATTPAGNHLAKDSNGEFVNTPDSGAGGGITTLNTLTATTQTFADVDDTNVTLAINSATSTHTFTLGWTGTLAASRLNANVVQAVSNDTNVTGSIATQTLTLGWTGTLAVSRGGLGANLSALTTNNLAKYNGTNFVDSLLASTVSGARAIFAGTLGADRTYTLPNITGTIALLAQDANFNTLTVNTNLVPDANDGAALGTTTLQFSDLFLAEGGVINWDNGDVTLTQSGNTLTVAGAELILEDASTYPTSTVSAGFRGIPQNSQSAAYTTVRSDAGKHILHPTADNNARTFTIDSNANVPYPIGTTITFVNQINTVTIAITSDTLTLYPAGTTGSRTLAANGLATATKVGTTSWVITGVGLT